MTKPNPGTKEAIEAGCICPVLDNNYGKGIPIKTKDGTIQTGYWMDGACPIHKLPELKAEDGE
jgi:hypothetical protein